MSHTVDVEIDGSQSIEVELDPGSSPETVREIVKSMPFTVSLNVWGEEIYTSPSPVNVAEENAKTPVELNDVVYWPTGRAICLFFGPTPISGTDEIVPASPVNVVGRIVSADKAVLKTAGGKSATFRLRA